MERQWWLSWTPTAGQQWGVPVTRWHDKKNWCWSAGKRETMSTAKCKEHGRETADSGPSAQGAAFHRRVRPTKLQSSMCADKSVRTRAGKAWKEKGGRNCAHMRAPGSTSPQLSGALWKLPHWWDKKGTLGYKPGKTNGQNVRVSLHYEHRKLTNLKEKSKRQIIW